MTCFISQILEISLPRIFSFSWQEYIRLDAQNFKMEGTNEERKAHVG